ncbi:MAG TPA: indole-3-glycerol phosphate synthase TrpC [Candidatus Anaerobutyricum stercoripullorum]|uniref:Indole-3-glycerol phosphate synthase n=1 Tax=Candidatus Anaerobutyricum stercoripullorum TaxID=2838456 RepID=A0A9D1X3I6_9FIRM|nr:indole-3-glycerol phosphate synthase TrpC [Candidatus Anaerobutyricum stercoripullorum]
MTILEQLAAHARHRVEQVAKQHPLEEVKRSALALPRGGFAFERALGKPGMSFICECKKASPSKGLIAPDFPYLSIAGAYAEAGADAISVLTEPKWFLGSDTFLREIAAQVQVPCLRKDFTVDAYMIYEAKLLGASAVLLIVSLLREEQLRTYMEICDELGLSALVEAHDEGEVRTALRAGARVVGVNNRNLKDFSVDTENSRRLRELVPEDVIFVSESGVRDAEDIRRLSAMGADAVLIGETLMRAKDKNATLAAFREAAL